MEEEEEEEEGEGEEREFARDDDVDGDDVSEDEVSEEGRRGRRGEIEWRERKTEAVRE